MRNVFCIAALALIGCSIPGGKDSQPAQEPAHILIIYYAPFSPFFPGNATERAARQIAHITGGALFNLADYMLLPDLLSYDTFFLGASLQEAALPMALIGFLAQTDFLDARVIPFWTSPDGPVSSDVQRRFTALVRGGRVLQGRGFTRLAEVDGASLDRMAADWAAAMATEIAARRTAGDRAEDVMNAFALAYPDRISPAVFRDGDWTVDIDGHTYFYAEGRLLREDERFQRPAFRAYPFYRYTPEQAYVLPPSPEEAAALAHNPWHTLARQHISRRRNVADYSGGWRPRAMGGTRMTSIYEAIWRIHNREDAEAMQQALTFLGWKIVVHQFIVEPLQRVEQRLRELIATDPAAAAWAESIDTAGAWYWRNIAGTQSLSFHSYGIAIDLVMTPQDGMETYWLWSKNNGLNWRTVPYEKRLHPPDSVVLAFEREGFTWGGKWFMYDTMHFEYRPEILILSFQSFQ